MDARVKQEYIEKLRKMNAAFTLIGIILTHDTTARNVIRAPKCGNLIGIVYGDVLENDIFYSRFAL